MKKIIFALSLAVGLLLASSALAAASASVTGSPTGVTVTTGQAVAIPAQSADNIMWPCGVTPMMQDGANMMYRQPPCNNIMQMRQYQYSPSSYLGRDLVPWLILMFVLTVIMVWVVLLLLITYLWKLVKKHGH